MALLEMGVSSGNLLRPLIKIIISLSWKPLQSWKPSQTIRNHCNSIHAITDPSIQPMMETTGNTSLKTSD